MEALKERYHNTKNDTLRICFLDSLSIGYSELNPDSSFYYAELGISLSKSLGFRINEAEAANMSAYALLNLGNYPASLQKFLSALDIVINPESEKIIIPEKYRRTFGILSKDVSPQSYRLQILSFVYMNMGILYENANNLDKALHNHFLALEIGEKTSNGQVISGTNMIIGRIYLKLNKKDSALIFEKKAYETFLARGIKEYIGSALLNLGRIYLADGKEEIATTYIHEAIKESIDGSYRRGIIAGNLLLADINIKKKQFDSAFIFTQNALRVANEMKAPDLLLRTYNSISDYYQSIHNNDSAVKYLNLVIKIKDSLFNSKQSRQFQNIDFDAMQRKQEIETAKKDYKSSLQKYVLASGLFVFIIIVIILWRNNSNKQKANRLLTKQKAETDIQKAKAEQALEELKLTQSQLIQKEKMASLGELTAGIAHEIQNPLNFVNNFSEVNKELIEELKNEKSKPTAERNEELEEELLNDIGQNLEKINLHGKRADAIVKGMLQHSRIGSGQKDPTDINALCNEYLRLAYHGLRAKDKSFNAKLETNFDPSINKVNVVSQDIGRVILNLFNNAFYSVKEKTKLAIPGYEPTISVSTKKSGNQIELRVKDNGIGIQDSIKEKIFQPFFTTKPPGQGTGLGLSLSYDIITKEHGGEISMNSQSGEFAEFTVNLPI